MPVKYNIDLKDKYESTLDFICDKCGDAKTVKEYDKDIDYSPEYETPCRNVYYTWDGKGAISGESLVENGYCYLYVKIRLSCKDEVSTRVLLCTKCADDIGVEQRREEIRDSVLAILGISKRE